MVSQNNWLNVVVQNYDTSFTIEEVLSNYHVFSLGNALRILEKGEAIENPNSHPQ